MSTRPVGVKLFKRGEAVPDSGHDKPERPMPFCRLVHEAAAGKNFLMRLEDLDCSKAEVALGFHGPKFTDVEPRIRVNTAALRIGPTEDSDVVMLVLNPEQVMSASMLIEGLSVRFVKNRAVCGAAMAQVYNKGQGVVTFLCIGARTRGGFQPAEVVMSLPRETFRELAAKMGKFPSFSRKVRESVTERLLRRG